MVGYPAALPAHAAASAFQAPMTGRIEASPEPFGIPGDRFVIERELGRGGFSTVYLAHDRKHDRRVAVKLLSSHATAAIGAVRFSQEIQLTAQLQHPHILPLLDSDAADGRAYYVMPFVDGESLRHRLAREGALPLRDALVIAREVADGLAYAHGRQVVHRDIKPENILLSAGHAIIADFGIARSSTTVVDADHRLTTPGLAIGTPAYMAPEQALDEAVDGRADLYALGCLLFEMLTGKLPFPGRTPMALLGAKLAGMPPAFPEGAAAIPTLLRTLITQLLHRDPDDRPRRAEAVITALDAALRGDAAPAVVREPAPPNTIAVLAFTSMSPDASDEYLADGISEALTHELGRVVGMRVIARTSAFVFKGSQLDVREIGMRLGVRRLVEGSVRRSGSQLRVTARLVDTGSGTEIWSERFDGSTADVFTIEDDLSRAVSSRLRALLRGGPSTHLTTHVPSAPPTSSLPAYEQYLKGRYWWSMRTDAAMQRSLAHLDEALAIDPQFASAAAAKAETLATLGLYGLAAPLDVMPQARHAAEQALALDAALAEALCARGCVLAAYDRNWDAATRDFDAAIAADPQYPTSYQWLASTVLVPQGRFEEAHQALATARSLDPLSRSIVVSSAAAHYYERNADAAIADSREALQLDDRFAMGYFFLGLALELKGELRAARVALEQARTLAPSAEILAALGHLHAAAGDSERAATCRAELESQAAQRYQSPVLLAQIAAAQGQADEAVRLLAQARDAGAADLIWIGVRPAFDPLRTLPAFASLRRELQLPLVTFTAHDSRQ